MITGHYIFSLYCEAASPCFLKQTLWAYVYPYSRQIKRLHQLHIIRLMLPVSGKLWPSRYIYKWKPCKQKVYFLCVVWLGSLAPLKLLTGVQHALWLRRYIKMLKKRGKVAPNENISDILGMTISPKNYRKRLGPHSMHADPF